MAGIVVAGGLLALWLRHWWPLVQVAVLGAVFAAIDGWRFIRQRRAAPGRPEPHQL